MTFNLVVQLFQLSFDLGKCFVKCFANILGFCCCNQVVTKAMHGYFSNFVDMFTIEDNMTIGDFIEAAANFLELGGYRLLK